MEALVPYAIIAVLILAGLCVLAVLLFSLRGLAYGKVDALTVAAMGAVAVLFVLLWLLMPTWVMAAVWTAVILFGLTVLALLLSGLRSLWV